MDICCDCCGSVVGQIDDAVLNIPLDSVDMSVRNRRMCKQLGARYVGDIVQRTEAEILHTHYYGRKSIKELRSLVYCELGLKLGMRIPEWKRPNIKVTQQMVSC